MKKQLGCITVQVPPDIIDEKSTSDVTVNEGDNVTLTCTAAGKPTPRIVWRREDGQKITILSPPRSGSHNKASWATVKAHQQQKPQQPQDVGLNVLMVADEPHDGPLALQQTGATGGRERFRGITRSSIYTAGALTSVIPQKWSRIRARRCACTA